MERAFPCFVVSLNKLLDKQLDCLVTWTPLQCPTVRLVVGPRGVPVSRDLCLRFSGCSEADLTGRPVALLLMCLSNFRSDGMISDLRSRGFRTARVLRGNVLSIILKWIPARRFS